MGLSFCETGADTMSDFKLPLNLECPGGRRAMRVYDANGKLVGTIRDDAHAQAIIRAVNGHAGLVEACKQARSNMLTGPMTTADRKHLFSVLSDVIAAAEPKEPTP
jgi:hypothetical protein